MKKHSLCQHHKQQILQSEKIAFHYWQAMMQNAIRTYTECQNNKAEKYFHSAFEIALLRYTCDDRYLFSASHLMKPAEFLVSLKVQNMNFEHALLILSSLSSLSHSENIRKERDLWIFLNKQYQYVVDEKAKNNEGTNMSAGLVAYNEYSHAIH